jgi:hypothetical protein
VPAPPGTWTEQELKADAAHATRLFVQDRLAALKVERETYAEAHRQYAGAVRDLLAATDDLSDITGDSLKDRTRLGFARQLAVPPISVDDLDTLTDSIFGNWLGQTTDKGMRPSDDAFDEAARIISERIDRDRAPWLDANRSPTSAERETFIEWAAAGPAAGVVLTSRRSGASARQEEATRAAAKAAGYKEVTPPGTLNDPIKQMEPATYASASRKLSGTNMDVPVRLKQNHPTGQLFLAIECKVSNSSLNSRKRLIEVARKRDVWDHSGLPYSFRTAGVLSGVFSVERLVEAQRTGVFLFWEHRLSDLTNFLAA